MPSHARHHDVQNHRVELARQGRGGAIRAIEGGGGRDAFAGEILGQHLAQRGVVIDQKNVQGLSLVKHASCARLSLFVSRLFAFFTVYWRTLYPRRCGYV